WIAASGILFVLLVFASPLTPALNWGSRYLLTALPFFAIAAACALERQWTESRGFERGIAGFAIAATAAVCLFSQARGYLAIRNDLDYSHQLNLAVEQAGTPVVVTDIYWLGAELTPMKHGPTVFLVRDTEESRTALFHALHGMGV